MSDNKNPFSFFSWIFITPNLYDKEDLLQILTHEQTHARQLHSLDRLIAEFVTIFFWFNPFAWLLKQEVRTNLEHLADAKVLESGVQTQLYQYSLLRLCHQVTLNKLVDNFNISQFKRRIIMMNVNKSNRKSLIRYALFLPVAGLLLISSNAQAVVEKMKMVESHAGILQVNQVQFKERAMSTIKDKRPIYVVDGKVRYTDLTIDPENIKSINVIKGDYAIALYGTSGANGVILIETKDNNKKADQTTSHDIPQAQTDFTGKLIIIDGKEQNANFDMKSVDLNQIESISVLKEESAKGYGEKGKNGVILITMKK